MSLFNYNFDKYYKGKNVDICKYATEASDLVQYSKLKPLKE